MEHRISEKLHEMMVSSEETPRTSYVVEDDTYYMHYKNISKNPIDFEFTSDQVCVSKEELTKILKSYNYFKL